MKYYAVTDDPRELYHYGVKGMKWGQHIFGDKPKSPGYKRAVSKLRANSRAKEEHKYENAVKKSQDRIARVESLYKVDQKRNKKLTAKERNALTERLYKVDQEKALYKELAKEQRKAAKQQRIADRNYRAEEKRELKYAKNEAKMDKYLQQAREGKLKYGRLSEDQVQRIQQRLQLESGARRLESAEKTWRQQKKDARRAGYLSGITKGTSAAMEEVARASATYGMQHLLDRKKLKAKAKLEGKEDRIKNKERNKKTHKEIVNEFKQEAFKERVRSGEGVLARNNLFTKSAKANAKRLDQIERQKKLNDAYQDYLDTNALTDKQARKQYRESLSTVDASKYGKVRLLNKDSVQERQQRMLLAANKKAKEQEAKDEKMRDEIYKRYVMPGKNDNADQILARFENTDARNRIYGKTKTTKLSNESKAPTSSSNDKKSSLWDNLTDPVQIWAGVKQLDPDYYKGRKTTPAERRSINKQNKKLAKNQRQAIRKLNGY